MNKTLVTRVVTSLKTYDNDKGFHSLMSIVQKEAYETFTSSASHRRANGYATAGASPNALA